MKKNHKAFFAPGGRKPIELTGNCVKCGGEITIRRGTRRENKVWWVFGCKNCRR